MTLHKNNLKNKFYDLYTIVKQNIKIRKNYKLSVKESRKNYNGKNINDVIKSVKFYTNDKNIYANAAVNFSKSIDDYGYQDIINNVNKKFSKIFDVKKFSKNSLIRFYLIITNLEVLFNGYKKHIKFYEITKYLEFYKKRKLFYLEIIKNIKETEIK